MTWNSDKDIRQGLPASSQGKEAWSYLSRLTFIAGGMNCYCRMEKSQLQEQGIWKGQRVGPGPQAEGLAYGRSSRTSMTMGGQGAESYSACPPEGHPGSPCLSSSVVSPMRHFCPLPAMPYLCPTSPWYWYNISLLQALDVVLLCPLTIRCPKAELMGPGTHPVVPLSNHSVHANEE